MVAFPEDKEYPVLRTSTPRILLVSEQEHWMVGIRSYLEGEGFDVVVAMDTSQASELLRNLRPDLVVLDIDLKASDPFTFLRQLSTMAGRLYRPVIAISSRSEAVLMSTCFEQGISSYMVRPVTPRALVRKIERVLWDVVQARGRSGNLSPSAADSRFVNERLDELTRAFLCEASPLLQGYREQIEALMRAHPAHPRLVLTASRLNQLEGLLREMHQPSTQDPVSPRAKAA